MIQEKFGSKDRKELEKVSGFLGNYHSISTIRSKIVHGSWSIPADFKLEKAQLSFISRQQKDNHSQENISISDINGFTSQIVKWLGDLITLIEFIQNNEKEIKVG